MSVVLVGGCEASRRRRGIGDEQRQPAITRQAELCKRSNWVTLVVPRKGNQPGEAYVMRGRRKALYRMDSDSFEGPKEAAEMQRNALSLGKNLAFRVETCFEKDSVRSKVTPRNLGVGSKVKGRFDRKSLG